MKGPKQALQSRLAKLILVCFFLSGLTGLIYQILWTRMIVAIIGCSPFSVSIVLTVFMGGLGLGSYLASRATDRLQDPIRLIRVYGLLELTVGGYCLILPVLFHGSVPLYATLYNRLFEHFMVYNLLTFLGCGLLLLVPVICMGATLPILCQFYVSSLSHLGSRTGLLYGINTIGAAVGAMVCGFWLIDLLGLVGTSVLAVIINGVIGVSCVWASYRVPSPTLGPQEGPRKRSTVSASHPAAPSGAVVVALIVFAVSGFCGMAYEVIWTKLLGLIVGPTTYSFTVVLVTFITCLALGSFVFGWLADRVQQPLRLLLGTQCAAALAALAVSHLLGNSQLFFAKLLYQSQDHFVLMSILKAVSLFGFLCVPTVLLGATFPLVGKICTQSVSSVGHTIGRAYAVNTIGAVLGSFCAGFVLIPMMGKEHSLSLVVALQLMTSLLLTGAIWARDRESRRRPIVLGVSALIGLGLCLHYPFWNRELLSTGKYQRFDRLRTDLTSVGWIEALVRGGQILSPEPGSELVYYGDGIGGFTTVQKFGNIFGDPAYQMNNSGKPDASTIGDMATQTLLAHFPMLCHPNPRTVMILGFASGITAGEVQCYPVDKVDILEISPQVVEASRYFVPWNNDVLSNPKTDLIIQDGRSHLQLTDRTYDVIISEPSNPWMAGLAALFTRDFFSLAKERLNAGGLFVQWIHSYQMDWSVFSLVGRTFVEVFPNSLLVTTRPSGSGPDFLLVGFKGEGRWVLGSAEQRLEYAQRSRNVTLPDARVLYRLVLNEELQTLFGEGPINTDVRPRLEFAAPKLMYHTDEEVPAYLAGHMRLTETTAEVRRQVLADVDAQVDLATYALSINSPFANMVDLAKATPAQTDRFCNRLEAYAAKHLLDFDYSLIPDENIKRRCRLAQIRILRSKMDAVPDKTAGICTYLADLYTDVGMLEEAVAHLRKALDLKPDNLMVMNNLAWRLAVNAQAKYHDPKQAVRLAEEACRRTEYRLPILMDTLAVAYGAAGRFMEASTTAETAISLALASGDGAKAKEIRDRARLFAAGRPYVEPLPAASAE